MNDWQLYLPSDPRPRCAALHGLTVRAGLACKERREVEV